MNILYFKSKGTEEVNIFAGMKSWEVQKSKLKIKFPKLKDTDLDFDERDKDEMLVRLQDIIGKTKKELQTIIETL